MNAALVELVEHHRDEVREQWILLQPPGEDAFGCEQHARLGTELALEPDVPADLAPRSPATFVRNSSRDAPGRDAPRLEHDDRSVARERRRHTGRLAGTRRSCQHQRATLADSGHDVGQVRIDRQWSEAHQLSGWDQKKMVEFDRLNRNTARWIVGL